MTLVEVVVAMAIVTVGVLGMLTEVVSYVRDQSTQRAHATALRIATTTLEDARSQNAALLSTQSPTTTPPKANGIAYTTSTNVQHVGGVARITVTVSWTDGHGPHSLSLDSSTTDLSTSTLAGSTSGLTNNVTGASGTSVTAGTLSLTPSSTSVDSSGSPADDVVASLNVVGLTTATSIPLTWTDDSGAHQVTMANTGGTTWSATVSKNAITRKVTSGSKTVTFAATVPGVATPITTNLTVVPVPAFNGSCTVTVSPIVTLLRKTTVPEIISCSTTGLASTDQLRATYASGSGTASASLSSVDGSTWTTTLPAGTAMAATGSSESFTFTLMRSSDGYTKSQNLSVTLT